ncbi:MAG: hypothetical protein Q9162_006513 [Coniocarpon cinnabarinum]
MALAPYNFLQLTADIEPRHLASNTLIPSDTGRDYSGAGSDNNHWLILTPETHQQHNLHQTYHPTPEVLDMADASSAAGKHLATEGARTVVFSQSGRTVPPSILRASAPCVALAKRKRDEGAAQPRPEEGPSQPKQPKKVRFAANLSMWMPWKEDRPTDREVEPVKLAEGWVRDLRAWHHKLDGEQRKGTEKKELPWYTYQCDEMTGEVRQKKAWPSLSAAWGDLGKLAMQATSERR